MQARVHLVVHGLVQGVGFRWFVARRADGLGLSGYVRNLYDGSVEAEAEGDRSLSLAWIEPLHTQSGFSIR